MLHRVFSAEMSAVLETVGTDSHLSGVTIVFSTCAISHRQVYKTLLKYWCTFVDVLRTKLVHKGSVSIRLRFHLPTKDLILISRELLFQAFESVFCRYKQQVIPIALSSGWCFVKTEKLLRILVAKFLCYSFQSRSLDNKLYRLLSYIV